MKPKLTVYIPPHISPVHIPEFDVTWRIAVLDLSKFLDVSRRQCRADVAVETFAVGVSTPTVYVLDCDGYYPGFNFLFGLAQPALRTAVVFTARLRGPLFAERLAKEITHEAGHLYGLGHCSDARCVMYFSNTLLETDRKSVYFCEKCRRKLLARYLNP
jgi:Predicted Zn-dependent proteases